mmetsp:Transcript_7866/g.13031  ORF Transcript_7866/g.13031 Transcript_7866/m.13031 type:complete len:147 (+) Transcript_7866:78-518(+)|eukprot:CAMPEP_0119003090 /NCGR_PEP_ID=MMETSP1176-20130426/350_1 /TAXON_ID=265551 /ORGANISM="Synedropsis recta cf, Strain CCMP1620" /LENGTH=146 /DNA_ID=CAMNT_0006954655 /DNA_START=78 /DNA_END=518 /DNA_ORIENTATION=+
MFRLLIVALIASCAAAFAPTFTRTQSLTVRQVLLSDDETKAILQSGTDCVESECSVDDVSMLVAELTEQEKLLTKRLGQVMNMVAHLQHVNEKEGRETDEVRSFVKDLLNVFSTDHPTFSGASLDMSKGPFDSYDVLGAKPWKKKD